VHQVGVQPQFYTKHSMAATEVHRCKRGVL